MQRSHTSLSTPISLTWIAAIAMACAWCVGACYGQASPAGEPRYGAAPDFQAATAATQEPTAGEPLISYRRDESGTANTVRVAAADTTRGKDVGVEEPLNPLRASVQPSPPKFDPIRPVAEPTVEASTAMGAGRYSMPASAGSPTPASIPSVNISSVAPLPAPPVTTPAVSEVTQSTAAPAPAVVTPQNEQAAVTNPFAAMTAPPRYDAAVAPAAYEADSSKAEKHTDLSEVDEKPVAEPASGWADRRLAPPSTESKAEGPSQYSSGLTARLPFGLSKVESLSTAGAGLAIVVGLLIVCMWLVRRGGGKGSGLLPAQAFAMLGRAPLTAQSYVHLLRVGNKLVLVAMTGDGAQPLTEVTDPMEVDRLTGLCASTRGHGPAAEFQQVLAQLAREPARGFLGNEATGRRSA